MARKLQIAFPVPAEGAEQGYANYYNAFAALGAALIPVDALCNPEAFDGMVLPGGADVDPVFYHRENIACGTLEPELDRLQLGALERFAPSGKPVLGICRGHQVLNVFFGGTLIQHLPVSVRHARGEGEHTDKVHDSRALPGSFAPVMLCTGTCERERRPLGCRIFPLTPVRGRDGAWTVRMDARARAMCPLVRSGVRGLDPDFVRAVRRALRIIAEDPDGDAFLEKWRRLEEEYRKPLW